MNKRVFVLFLSACILITSISLASAYENKKKSVTIDEMIQNSSNILSGDYYVQWVMNFGSDWRYGARYEGPQPIGDCDNDGKNEFILGGRDGKLRIMEWNESKQTYLEMHTLFCPSYPFDKNDAGGFAIGDITNDGKDEIAASWPASIYKWVGGKYKVLGWNSWIFNRNGGSADCYIGDCDNDGKNELIMSGGPMSEGSSVPEIVIFEWSGLRLVKVAEWDDLGVNGFVYMAGLGDVDDDGENEIVCGTAHKVVVLDWNKNSKEFEATTIKTTYPEGYPFACVCKDSDMDGKLEIHVGYYSPTITILEWNGVGYVQKFEKTWPGEGVLIEALDVGDVDDDSIAEVCAGTNRVHILQWNGSTYVEEAVLPTFGDLAVLSIGDCDNDGKNEINAGSVMVEHGQDFMSWVYKYEPNSKLKVISYQQNLVNGDDDIGMSCSMMAGSLNVKVCSSVLGKKLGDGSIAAWDLENNVWYDVQPLSENPYSEDWGSYVRYNLPSGEYLLRAKVEGYKVQETNITIVSGQVTSYTFNLQRDLTINSLSTSIAQYGSSSSVKKNLQNSSYQQLNQIICKIKNFPLFLNHI
ncbi:MAG: hypothetical protein QHH19_06840 [Candidatus Thermoplasmatota archaeon]|jgi:hypothetical protein|nr:hypothetical protein [Candidatus Thermoplasmatota archaeon]